MKNNNATKTGAIPKKVLELLPWFMTGKLSVDDQAFFKNAFQSYPSLSKEFKIERQMIDLISADKSLLEKSMIAPPEERIKAVFNSIDAHQPKVSSGILGVIKEAFDSLIANLGLRPQHTAIAGISVLALSVAVLSSFVMPSKTDTSDFVLASAESQAIDDQQTTTVNAIQTKLLVGFNGTALELSKHDALKNKQIDIVSPPNKDDFFQIIFKQSINADEIKQILEALLAQEETVWFAGEAF